VIQWEKDDLDPVGLVKIDLLGLGMLTVVQDCLLYIRHTRGTTIDLGQLDMSDQAVYDVMCRADTVGLFQIESRAQMNTLPRLKPRCFYDLVVEVALIRPGPIQGEMVHPYLRRRAGLEPVTYPHPMLEKVLKRTMKLDKARVEIGRVSRFGLLELRPPGDQSPPEGSGPPQQGLLLGWAGTGLALLRPAAVGQRQEAGVASIELSHQPLGGSHQGILIAAPGRLVQLVEVALQGHGLEREAPEHQEHGNPQGQGQNEAALRRGRMRAFARNEGGHGRGWGTHAEGSRRRTGGPRWNRAEPRGLRCSPPWPLAS
jgi:hypothetical protein